MSLTQVDSTPQERMKAKLQALGIAHKNIEVYGRRIVVTSLSLDAANRWAWMLGKFANVGGIVPSLDDSKENRSLLGCPTTHRVFRIYATVQS